MFVRRLLTLPYGGGSTLVPNMEIAKDRLLKIGQLARQTGLSIKTIRYYESRGCWSNRYARRVDTASTDRRR
jgi:MerR family regulatory protein